jgi:proline dehydrogenase
MAIEQPTPERRRRNSPVYEGFPKEVELAGRDLRATQTAINATRWCSVHRRDLFQAFIEVHNGEGAKPIEQMISDTWREYATQENGFRRDDGQLHPNDPFRKRVESSLTSMICDEALMEITPEFQTPEEGMPKGPREAEATNRMTRVISTHIQDSRKQVEDVFSGEGLKFRLREALKKIDQFLITLIMKYKGVKEKGEEENEEELIGNLWGMIKFVAIHGGEEFLSQIQREAKAKEEGRTDRETLDNPRVNKLVGHFSKAFIAGNNVAESLSNPNVQRLLENGIELTLAPEIESTGSLETARKNFEEFKKCLEDMPEKHTHMSMKPSSLALCTYEGNFEDLESPPEITEERAEAVKEDLRKLIDIVMEKGKFIRIDAEQFFYKDMVLKIFKDLIDENPKRTKHLGIVIQAYQKESKSDTIALIEWAKTTHSEAEDRISIRLVKGAYAKDKKDPRRAREGFHQNLTTRWFGEEREAWEERHTENPILGLEETQIKYTEIMKLLEQNTRHVDTAYGLHNHNHMAQIIQTWMNNGQIPSRREIQTLIGMYDWEKLALKDLVKQRAYIPFGNLGKILEYMYRRFEELEKDLGFLETKFDEYGHAVIKES